VDGLASALPKNPDPGFTPGSESNSVAVSSDKNIESLDFTLLASESVALDRQWSLRHRARCITAMQRFDPARRLQASLARPGALSNVLGDGIKPIRALISSRGSFAIQRCIVIVAI
jgi:hypothetical protein